MVCIRYVFREKLILILFMESCEFGGGWFWGFYTWISMYENIDWKWRVMLGRGMGMDLIYIYIACVYSYILIRYPLILSTIFPPYGPFSINTIT